LVIHPSILNQSQPIPFRQSYSSRPNRHISRKTPACTHSWKRSWAVEPGQNWVASRAFHWQPVRRTKKMASMQTRSGVRGRPPPKRCVFTCSGSKKAISSHSLSGMRQASVGVDSAMVSVSTWTSAAPNQSAAAYGRYYHSGVNRIGSKFEFRTFWRVRAG
jgi:hypothetical protein